MNTKDIQIRAISDVDPKTGSSNSHAFVISAYWISTNKYLTGSELKELNNRHLNFVHWYVMGLVGYYDSEF